MSKTRERKALNCFIDADVKDALSQHSETYGISQGAIVNLILKAALKDQPLDMKASDQVLSYGQEMIDLISRGGHLSEEDKLKLRRQLQDALDELK